MLSKELHDILFYETTFQCKYDNYTQNLTFINLRELDEKKCNFSRTYQDLRTIGNDDTHRGWTIL